MLNSIQLETGLFHNVNIGGYGECVLSSLTEKKRLVTIVSLFLMGSIIYVFAALSAFLIGPYGSDLSPFFVVTITLLGGLGSIALGYASVMVLGGRVSLDLNEFVARMTMCKQVIEVSDDEKKATTRMPLWRDFGLYMPALIFGLSLMLAWDIHNLHDPQTSFFYPIFHVLDVFSRPIAADHLSRSIEVVLAMIVLVGIVGIAPAISLPYFRKFKVTGVNSGPFHTNFLYLVVGLIVGIGTLLTLVGFLYNVLWVGKGPVIYHYVLLALLGLSLHYTLGAFLARDKTEKMIMAKLRATSGKRIIRGAVVIQGS